MEAENVKIMLSTSPTSDTRQFKKFQTTGLFAVTVSIKAGKLRNQSADMEEESLY